MIIKLGDILNDSINRAGIKNQVSAALVLDKFSAIMKELLGEEIANDIFPQSLENNVLKIKCFNSSLRQEIKLREKTIIYKLNSAIGKTAVEKIIFVV